MENTVGKVAVLVELDYCVGCYACQSACQDCYDLPVTQTYLRNLIMKPERVDGNLESFMSPIPLALNHCAECLEKLGEAPCAQICIGKALHIASMEDIFEMAKGVSGKVALFA